MIVAIDPSRLRLELTDEIQEGRPLWKHLESIRYRAYGRHRELVVEQVILRGEKTDLGSIPRAVPRWIADENEPWNIAYAVHDHMCRHKIESSELAADIMEAILKTFATKSTPKEIRISKFGVWYRVQAVRMFGPKWSNGKDGMLPVNVPLK